MRCELDGVMNYKGQDQLLSIKALNEFDPKHTGVSMHTSPNPSSSDLTATEQDEVCAYQQSTAPFRTSGRPGFC